MTAIDRVFGDLTEGQKDWYGASVKRITMAMKLSDAILDDAGYSNPTADQTIALAGIIIKDRAMQSARFDHDRLIETMKDLA